jgi:hypothetical protein
MTRGPAPLAVAESDVEDDLKLTRQRGYPPEKQEKAAETVMKQAELLAAEWPA